MEKFDVIVIGGGPSGMSAAISASEGGASVCLVERDKVLGGILNQCIHNGFGLSYFKEELTGPEYASKLAKMVKKHKNITVLTSTFVKTINDKKVEIINKHGAKIIKAKAIILAMGCRERTAGAITLKGNRPSGLMTAGMAQKMINHYGKLPGKTAVILGSGDIGLIMARRLKFEGVDVKAIFEIMYSSSGLARNIRQCVEDFDIPLYYNTTITSVVGDAKVEGIFYAKVDDKMNPIKDTEKYLKCDCILLSVGLIPENDLVSKTIEFDRRTKGAIVDENRQTSCPGMFATGNVLHIHDLADNATIEGKIAGEGAVKYINGQLNNNNKVDVVAGENISYVLPQKVTNNANKFCLFLRVKTKLQSKKFVVSDGDTILKIKPFRALNPGEMQEIEVESKQKINSLKVEII